MTEKPWGIYMCVRQGGISRDYGLHSSYATKEEAEAAQPEIVEWFSQFYNEIGIKIIEKRADNSRERIMAQLSNWL